jgi:hypothetical protein
MAWMFNAIPCPVYSWKETWYPLYNRVGASRGQSGQLRKISPAAEFDPHTIQTIENYHTDCVLRYAGLKKLRQK